MALADRESLEIILMKEEYKTVFLKEQTDKEPYYMVDTQKKAVYIHKMNFEDAKERAVYTYGK